MGERPARVSLPSKAADATDEAPAIIRDPKAHRPPNLSAGDILTLLRQLDIPCSIDSFSEMGWTAKLGGPEKGFYAQQSRFPTIDAAATWLLEEARRQFPSVMPGE